MAFYIDSKCPDADLWIGKILSHFINSHSRFSTLVFLCIGSDCSCGDSLGAFIGSMLDYRLAPCPDVQIYGSLKSPVHALNLKETMTRIHQEHKRPLIVALDASMGDKKHQAYITIENGAISPGAGVAHKLPKVGHISITGIVNGNGCMEPLVLQTTSLGLIIGLAQIICNGIFHALAGRFLLPEDLFFHDFEDFLWAYKKPSIPASCSEVR